MTNAFQVPLLKQSTRRWLVVGCYGGYALLVLAWIFVPLSVWRWVSVLVIGLICVLCMGSLMMPNLMGISDGDQALLDERQRNFRNAMYVRAYQILAVVFLGIGLYGYIAGDSKKGWLPQSSLELQGVFWGLWLFVMTLPAALIAWLEPDPIED